MKSILLVFLSLIFISIKSYCQQVAYEDLIGTKWIEKETFPPGNADVTVTYEFKDSSKCTEWLTGPPGVLPPARIMMDYSLNFKYDISIFRLIERMPIKRGCEYWLIKLAGKDSLKMQLIYDTSKVNWNNNIITFLFTKSG